MIITIILFLISIIPSFAFNANCEQSIMVGETAPLEFLSQIQPIAQPDCLTPLSIFDIDNALMTPVDIAKSNDARIKVCKPCLEKSILKQSDPKSSKINFTNLLLSEAKKNLSRTMLDIMNVRAFDMDLSDNKSASACDFNNYEKKIISCLSKAGIEPDVKNLAINGLSLMKAEMRQEFVNLVSPKKNQTPNGLLKRTEEGNQCGLEDRDVLTLKSKQVEEKFLKSLNRLKTMNISDGAFEHDLIEGLKNKEINKSENKDKVDQNAISIDELRNHPIFKLKMSDAASFKNFLNEFSGVSDIKEFRTKLYSKANAQKIDADIANKCERAFKNMESNFCSSEFESGKVFYDDRDSVKNLTNLKIDKLPAKKAEKNIALINFCQDFFQTGKKISVSQVQKLINPDISNRSSNFESYSSDLYTRNLQFPSDEICEKMCKGTAEGCKSVLETDVSGSNLADALHRRNKDIDGILRSLLGRPTRDEFKKDSPELATFEREGIIPMPSGKYATNEPKADEISNFSVTNPGQTANLNAVPDQQNGKADKKVVTLPKPDTKVVSYDTDKTPATPPTDYVNPSVESEQDISTDLQRKILDRLDNQLSAKQIEAMVAKAYNQGRANPLTPPQVTAKTKEILEEMPNDFSYAYGSDGSLKGGKAAVSRDPAKEKKAAHQLGFLKAKYGIDPNATAKVANRQAPSTTSEDLQVVAINGAAELKIVVDDIKNIKGQEIAKLIETETPFILKIGKVSYKVSFANNKVNISIPEGMIRNPAAITQLEEYITSLASRNAEDPLTKKENRKLYKNLQKVKYQES